MLAYNFAFARGVEQTLAGEKPGVLYQRHCALSIAGALLSRRLQIPLILEYNNSEVWVAKHWDPSPLRPWIKLCEDISLRAASRIMVVSEALREDLLQRGVDAGRIRVNPNGVDPDFFFPGAGRESQRKRLGIDDEEVVVGFVGSFSFWHGIDVLESAIKTLLSKPQPCRFRFLLVGDGLLHGEMRSALATWERSGEAIFTGLVPRDKVVAFLDAADILVSPHVPMPDGSRFFGSPTKLFEYMAMGKGIVASRLEQIGEVLEHEESALLVTPGDAGELADAILQLALDPRKRAELGAAARSTAVQRYSWAHNVAMALDTTLVERSQFAAAAQ
jgi:glycosyltransferase involved in cell wall biosynthesis